MNAQQTRSWLIVALAAAASAASYLLLIGPNLSAAAEFRATGDQAAVSTRSLAGTIATLGAKEDNLPAAETEYRTLASRFPAEFDAPSWVKTLQAAASESGVTLTGLSPAVPALDDADSPADVPPPPAGAVAPTAGRTVLATAKVTLSATGPAGAVRDFVAAVAELDTPVLMETVTYVSEDGRTSLTVAGTLVLLAPMDDPAAAPGTQPRTATPAPLAPSTPTS